jgi:hypothetical protein
MKPVLKSPDLFIYTKNLTCVCVLKSVFVFTNHIPEWHAVINNKPDGARMYFGKKQIKRGIAHFRILQNKFLKQYKLYKSNK